jgi:hypothetical protein
MKMHPIYGLQNLYGRFLWWTQNTWPGFTVHALFILAIGMSAVYGICKLSQLWLRGAL